MADYLLTVKKTEKNSGGFERGIYPIEFPDMETTEKAYYALKGEYTHYQAILNY